MARIIRPAISRSYLIPAIFLNPVLFLMSLNTILSRLLPPIAVDAVVQPPPYSTYGPSAQHPHLDIHKSQSLCWSYTVFMVCAQMLAFNRVSVRREERSKRKAERMQVRYEKPDNDTVGYCKGHINGSINGVVNRHTGICPLQTDVSDIETAHTTDTEIIL